MNGDGIIISQQELRALYQQREQLLSSQQELAEHRAEREAREAAIAAVEARNNELERTVTQQNDDLRRNAEDLAQAAEDLAQTAYDRLQQEQDIAYRDQDIARKAERIRELEAQVEKLRRMHFGSKRERFEIPDGQQILPFLTDENLVKTEVEAEKQKISYERKRPQKKHPGRLPLPENLPVEEIRLEPTEDVSGMRCIGEEITEEIGYTPARVFVRRFIRAKYISQEDDQGKQSVVIAPLPERPLDKCEASAELLAQMIIDKHVYHMPIHRQLQEYATLGIRIPASTADNWQRLLGELLRPLYAALRVVVTTVGYLQADESPIKVLDRTKKGTTHRGVMWVYHAVLQKAVYFDYQRGHGRVNCREILSGIRGYLQTDDNKVYLLYKARSDIIGLSCWAHVRRKFFESQSEEPERAVIALRFIRKLYDVEADARQAELSAERRKDLRLEQSLPVLNLLGKWLVEQAPKTTPKSKFGTAVRYAINNWDELQNYLLDGSLEIDNNLIENLIRPLALGRKNYLFAGSHDGAVNIAMYRSFFGTCKLNGIDPRAWLLYVLTHIRSTPSEEYHNLLPQNIDPSLLN